jgi:heterodisulfide reductase subunit C/nitrate reductase gamma subunit
MLFSVSLYASLIICGLGLAYKLWRWLTTNIGPESRQFASGARLAAVIRGCRTTIFSRHLLTLLKVILLDGLLQLRVLKNSSSAWLAHTAIFWGFILLVLMHALDDYTRAWLPGYESTLNPYLFLRNLFGALVLAGAAIAAWRRFRLPIRKLTARPLDHITLGIMALIIVSGFAFEGMKIMSYQDYDRMIQDYSPSQEPADLMALRTLWANEYGVVFPKDRKLGGADVLARGRELNAESCLECHSNGHSAFLSYSLSRLAAPAAVKLADAGAVNWLWHIHFLATFAALALLPFSKFLHLFTTPLLLMVRAVSDREKMDPAARTFLRALELDACMHCAACSVHCSVAAALHEVPNLTLLPSEKLRAIFYLAGRAGDDGVLRAMREGAYICTSCYRCTRICPAGIDLQDLWDAMKQDLAAKGLGETYEDVLRSAHKAAEPSRQLARVKLQPQAKIGAGLSSEAKSFQNCFTCMTCTNACPVVMNYAKPKEVLDLLPHQIMHALAVGLREEAMGAGMVWNCLTCYRCQEACPQGVLVTEVLGELRNLASHSEFAQKDRICSTRCS